MTKAGRFLRRQADLALVFLAFWLVEAFAYGFLGMESHWPLAFGVFWSAMLTGLLLCLPGKAGRWVFGVLYFFFLAYAVVQTGYYLLFKELMWFDDFRYVSEGSDYFSVLLSYPILWWVGIAVLLAAGILLVRYFPIRRVRHGRCILGAVLAAAGCLGALFMPEAVFLQDSQVKYAGSDYGRSQSMEAAYENLFNAHRLYQVCGLYQTAVKDVYAHHIYPLTPGYRMALEEDRQVIDSYFETQLEVRDNDMTGLLKDKNVILVLMESMDDWMMGEHTPTLNRLMEEGISFTSFYTPVYGGIRTFNTEFCINTGSFLNSSGGYAFDYVTNHYDQSLANRLKAEGYSALTFHYNAPEFYSRGVFSQAMGYEDYISYEDYVPEKARELYDDNLLFDNEELNSLFFREGKKLNFVITRSAHLSYKYNEVLSYWGLEKYPEYRGLTGNEETDCAYLKARLVDDFFARMVEELEKQGQLEDTVIIGVTDHYTYGYKNTSALLELSGVEEEILLEKTPCFIWSPGLEAQEVDKVLNTSDLLPTVLNLMGVESSFDYLGRDAFEEGYEGFVPFSNGSWIYGDTAYEAGKGFISISGSPQAVTAETQKELAKRVQDFVQVNNLILKTDYYR